MSAFLELPARHVTTVFSQSQHFFNNCSNRIRVTSSVFISLFFAYSLALGLDSSDLIFECPQILCKFEITIISLRQQKFLTTFLVHMSSPSMNTIIVFYKEGAFLYQIEIKYNTSAKYAKTFQPGVCSHAIFGVALLFFQCFSYAFSKTLTASACSEICTFPSLSDVYTK